MLPLQDPHPPPDAARQLERGHAQAAGALQVAADDGGAVRLHQHGGRQPAAGQGAKGLQEEEQRLRHVLVRVWISSGLEREEETRKKCDNQGVPASRRTDCAVEMSARRFFLLNCNLPGSWRHNERPVPTPTSIR